MNRDKLIKNEQIVRDRNQAISSALKKYLGGEEDITHTPLEFVCECSDINCTELITVTIAEYERLHKRNNRFLIVRGHATPQIESTIALQDRLELVEKPDLSA